MGVNKLHMCNFQKKGYIFWYKQDGDFLHTYLFIHLLIFPMINIHISIFHILIFKNNQYGLIYMNNRNNVFRSQVVYHTKLNSNMVLLHVKNNVFNHLLKGIQDNKINIQKRGYYITYNFLHNYLLNLHLSIYWYIHMYLLKYQQPRR